MIRNGKQTPPNHSHWFLYKKKLICETRVCFATRPNDKSRAWDSKGEETLNYKLMQIGYCVLLFFLFRYETKRMEIEKWLQRMESRLEQMGKIATTVDVLEAQQKEQKVK